MYSILRKVDNYVKKNNISINGVVFSASYFPKYLNKAILNEVRFFRDDFFDYFNKDITLAYDNSGKLYMLVHDLRKRHNIAIVDESGKLDVNYTVDRIVSESDLIRNASMLKYVEKYMIDARKTINKEHPHSNKFRKDIMEYELLQETLKKANKKLVMQNKDITKVYDYSKELYWSVYKINRYMSYLDQYNVSIKKKIK